MPRLPDLDSLGARPAPVSRRGVASGNPAAGAIGAAVADVGGMLTGMARQQFEKEDKLSFAAARSTVLRADIEARRELENDPDYTTYDARYSEKMATARTEAAKLIRSKSDRQLFEADAGLDFERGRSEILKAARVKEVDAKKAVVFQSREILRDVAHNASDEGTRAAAINTANELFAGAQKDGILDPLAAAQAREDLTSDIVENWITGALNRESPEDARKLLDQYGDKINWKTRDGLEARTRGVLDVREAVSGVDAVMGTATRDEGATVTIADPLRGRGSAPVPGGQFGAARDYGSHHGVDKPAPIGTPVYSAGLGIASVSKSKLGGNIVTVTQPDGTTWKFMHLGKVNVKNGDEVTPDTVVGTVGMTGRSTGPHLHYEVEGKDGKPINPEKVIGTAQQSPQRHDLNAIYSQIDALAAKDAAAGNPWTPEKVERWKQEADRRVSRDEQLAARDDRAKMRAALDAVDKLGDNFTDTSKIPGFANLAPDDRIQLHNMADANRRALISGQEVKADGEVAITMNVLAARDPDAFMSIDLRTVRPFMKPSEFESLAVSQANMAREKAEKPSATSSLRTAIDGAITYYNKISGAKPFNFKSEEDRTSYSRMISLMRDHLNAATGGKRAPTDDELKSAYDSATMKVWANKREVPRYQVQPGQAIGVQIPDDVRARIVAGLARNGDRNPTEFTIGQTYLRGKGKPGLWQ